VEEPAILYIKSQKVEQVQFTKPQSDHWCTEGYRSTKTDLIQTEEDRRAVEMLDKAGLQYTLVDLGTVKGLTRLSARVKGVRITPTLVYKRRRFVGLGEITSILRG